MRIVRCLPAAAALLLLVVPAEAHAQDQVQFNENVVEIAPAVLERFIAGLEAEKPMISKVEAQNPDPIIERNRARRAEYERARDAYMEQAPVWEACREEARQKAKAAGDASAPDGEAVQPISEEQAAALQQRMMAAQQRGDIAEVRRLADSLSRAMQAQAAPVQAAAMQASADAEAVFARESAKCGEEPVNPTEPEYEHILDATDVTDAGAKASGFNPIQYRILRERIVPFVAARGVDIAPTAYSQVEIDALRARLDVLVGYEEQLRSY